jgi:predicted transcriptional regulator
MDNVTSNSSLMIEMASDIVSAYVSKNSVQVAELHGLIAFVHASLVGLYQPAAAAEEDHKVTAAQIRKSVTPDTITSFLDGKPYKSLKRHLTSNGLTPDDYRKKFGLPFDYPMVAASYAAQRSELAKSLGLGQIRRQQAEARKAQVKAADPALAKRGWPKKDKAAAAK